jgi:hypothetical protein
LSEGLGRTPYRPHEFTQLLHVELPACANARTQIETERLDSLDRLSHIRGTKATGQENWNLDFTADSATYIPIVNTTRTSKFLDVKSWVSRVEQQRVYKALETLGFFQRILAQNVNDLDELYVWDLAP